MIVARRLTVVGHTGLPQAQPTNLGRLLAGLEDSQLVQFHGVVRDITRDDAQHLIIGLSHDNQRFTTYVPPDPLARLSVFDALEDRSGTMWLATSNSRASMPVSAQQPTATEGATNLPTTAVTVTRRAESDVFIVSAVITDSQSASVIARPVLVVKAATPAKIEIGTMPGTILRMVVVVDGDGGSATYRSEIVRDGQLEDSRTGTVEVTPAV